MNTSVLKPNDFVDDEYHGKCSCCGEHSIFYRKHRSLREGYSCMHCRASMRYRGQTDLLVLLFGNSQNTCLADLAVDPEFSKLSIFEPGVTGPFRPFFESLKNYQNSFYWDDVELGAERDGVRCENLEKLTFADDSIDLMISSDILEHVRRPIDAFRETHRVLKLGGVHIFSVPAEAPLRANTRMRVDTTTEEDIFLEEPHYHGDGTGGRSLVYTDFGRDLVDQLLGLGFMVSVHSPKTSNRFANRLVTFAITKI